MGSRPKSPGANRGQTRELLREYGRTRDPALRERLVQAHASLVFYLARRYAGRGEPLEDLVQVGQIGLLAALDRFDPERGAEFTTYAMATILGEIKRYFRDKSWAIHVPRRLRELNNALMRTMDQLTQRLGRSPTIPEIAAETGVAFEDVVEALEVGQAYKPLSLDAAAADHAEGESILGDVVGEEDVELERSENRHALEKVLSFLPERQREIIRLRYYQNLSQADIALRLGISQMHVSRLQREALQYLRELLDPQAGSREETR